MHASVAATSIDVPSRAWEDGQLELSSRHVRYEMLLLTALLWFQKMNAGGSGELCTTHVRFIVDPLSMYKSGAPIISVDGSEKWHEQIRISMNVSM